MLMKNFEIYETARALGEAFVDNTQYLPVKVNFYIQKNKNTLMALAQDIEQARMDIIINYGTPNENGSQYLIDPDKIEIASKELEDLFNLEQEVNIYKVNIDSFPDDINLTTGQMEALMFMID